MHAHTQTKVPYNDPIFLKISFIGHYSLQWLFLLSRCSLMEKVVFFSSSKSSQIPYVQMVAKRRPYPSTAQFCAFCILFVIANDNCD